MDASLGVALLAIGGVLISVGVVIVLDVRYAAYIVGRATAVGRALFGDRSMLNRERMAGRIYGAFLIVVGIVFMVVGGRRV